MRGDLRKLLILIIILFPSARFAWLSRQMPEFAYLHDDGVMFVTAKSAAQGSYRILSLPENPPQTKFPPLYPLYLSLIWRIDPHFPDNLEVATALSWMVLAAMIVLAHMLYRRWGLSEIQVWLLTALVALNPYMVLFGCRMFSEVFFTCWVIAAFLVLSRQGLKMAAIAGIFAGCAYLSRTAGIALLVSIPALLLWKKESRRAAVFAAAMLPAVLGWMLWTRTHSAPSADSTLTYYTDYIRYQFMNVGFDNLTVVLWKNIDQVLYGMGALVLPKVIITGPLKILTQVIAVAMISGIVRMVRRGIAADYALFALISTGILIIWHFPPNERFVLPLYPLLIAGLLAELTHLANMLKPAFRHKDVSQRVVAGAFSAVVFAIFGAALAMQIYGTFVFLRDSADQKRGKLAELHDPYAWISANLPQNATVLSYNDGLLYLYTGRRGNYLPLMPRWWYAENYDAMVGAYQNVVAYCRSRHLQYIYMSSDDGDRELGDLLREKVQQAVRSAPGLTPVYSNGPDAIYRVD